MARHCRILQDIFSQVKHSSLSLPFSSSSSLHSSFIHLYRWIQTPPIPYYIILCPWLQLLTKLLPKIDLQHSPPKHLSQYLAQLSFLIGWQHSSNSRETNHPHPGNIFSMPLSSPILTKLSGIFHYHLPRGNRNILQVPHEGKLKSCWTFET